MLDVSQGKLAPSGAWPRDGLARLTEACGKLARMPWPAFSLRVGEGRQSGSIPPPPTSLPVANRSDLAGNIAQLSMDFLSSPRLL